MINKVEILKFAAGLYPCPKFYGYDIIIHIDFKTDSNLYIVNYNVRFDDLDINYDMFYHVNIWLCRICQFINLHYGDVITVYG